MQMACMSIGCTSRIPFSGASMKLGRCEFARRGKLLRSCGSSSSKSSPPALPRPSVTGLWSSLRSTPCPSSHMKSGFRPARPASSVAFKTDLEVDTRSARVAHRQQNMMLPLEYQQMLGFQAGSQPRDSDVNDAFDALTRAPTPEGYSEATQFGRAELLKIAKRIVLDSKAQRSNSGVFKTPVEDRHISVPPELVPVALAILAEVGQSALVLQLGQQALSSLEKEGSDDTHNDILLSMALASCDLARDALDSGSQASAACTHLAAAEQLLQRASLAPHGAALSPALQLQIQHSLRSLRAPSIYEELVASSSSAVMGGAAMERRKRAVRALRELLKDWSPSGGGGGGGGGLGGLGASVAAHVGSVLGRRYSPAAPSPSPVPAPEALVRQLLAALTCEELVHLLDWEQVARSAGAYGWLYCGLLHTVASGHIVTGFRQRQPEYINTAAAILKQLPQSARVLVMQGVCQLLLGSVQSSTELLKQAEALGGRSDPDLEDEELEPQWGPAAYSFVRQNSPPEKWMKQVGQAGGAYIDRCKEKVAFPLFPDPCSSSSSTSLSQYFDDTRVEALIAVYDEKGRGAGRGGGWQGRGLDLLALGAWVQGAVQGSRQVLGSAAAAAGPRTGLGWSAPSLAPKVVAGLALAALGLAAVGSLLAGASGARGRAGAEGLAPAVSSVHRAPSAQASAVSPEKLDVAAAERLMQQWQLAKQACLGANFDLSLLPGILTGAALSEAQQRAASFKDKGCYMQYKLWECEVSDIKVQRGGVVLLSAALDESASMLSRDGRTRDFYRSSYEARYQVVQAREGGGWRIAKITVVGENAENHS